MKLKTNGALTTGQVAKLCGVAPRTVSKWFDTGLLKGWLVPGSRDRRFAPETVARFIDEAGMPMPDELQPFARKAEKLSDACPKCGGYLSRVENAYRCVAPACQWSVAFPEAVAGV